MHTNTEDWKLVQSIAGPDLKLFKARFDYKINPRNGKTVKVVVLESNDSVNVIALTREFKMILTKQYRFGIERHTLELPGGMVDDGEDHKKAAIRELKEETGYTGEKYLYLGAVPSNPVFMDSSTHHWLIFDVEKTEDLELDDAEQIEVKEILVDEVHTLLKEHKIDHPHSVSALFRFFEYWKDHQNKILNV